MPRRASSGIHIGQTLGIAAALLGFVLAAVLVFKLVAGGIFGGLGAPKTGGSFLRDAAPLDLSVYLRDGKSLRGNAYQLTGKVEEILRWTPDRGRLISFDAGGGDGPSPVPVLIPQSFGGMNLERGSELRLVVRVDREGTLVAEGIED